MEMPLPDLLTVVRSKRFKDPHVSVITVGIADIHFLYLFDCALESTAKMKSFFSK
jgi:hypothetical protein